MVFLPEAFDYIGESAEETLALAQPLGGSTVRRFQAAAKQHNVWLSLGGFHRQAWRVPTGIDLKTMLWIRNSGSGSDLISH